ncbi:MAG: putative acyl-CoA dehydrogenase [Frankiales bacterium]|nr:putative acyl-CoA dehydrogenase [Frankiales bacterium]
MADYANDLAGFRKDLQQFLAEPRMDRWRDLYVEDVPGEMAETAAMIGELYDAGFGRYGFPIAAGGLGGDVRHCAVLFDELGAAGMPASGQYGLLTTLGAPVVKFAPELAAKYLPEFLSGKAWWGQGFSETEAGSDLAALRCRATPAEGGYRLSGHKTWTSHGATATRLVCLVRTGTQESRHRGLTMVMVDVDAPGVEVRPIELASGRAELAECFFDDVLVTPDRLVGEEGQGWAVAMFLLQYERAVYAWQRASTLMQRLRSLATEVAPTEQAERLIGSVYLDLIALRARSLETVRLLAAGESVGPEASSDKLLLGAAEQSVMAAARTLLGPAFVLGDAASRWREEWWFSRTTTIYGGSAEVQRGILADRVLNLPKG